MLGTRNVTPARRLIVSGIGLALSLLVGCSRDIGPPPPPPPPPPTPTAVLNNLVFAYKKRDIESYSRLLAEDFTFFLDPVTRPPTNPEFWSRLQDSTATARLLADPQVSDIRISLTYGPDRPVTEIGRERWRRIEVTDTFLEVDKPPVQAGAEVLTLRVDGDVQRFYFRKGRSPADTLDSSPTAKGWFLVEWQDLGHRTSPPNAWHSGANPAIERATWTGIKLVDFPGVATR